MPPGGGSQSLRNKEAEKIGWPTHDGNLPYTTEVWYEMSPLFCDCKRPAKFRRMICDETQYVRHHSSMHYTLPASLLREYPPSVGHANADQDGRHPRPRRADLPPLRPPACP